MRRPWGLGNRDQERLSFPIAPSHGAATMATGDAPVFAVNCESSWPAVVESKVKALKYGPPSELTPKTKAPVSSSASPIGNDPTLTLLPVAIVYVLLLEVIVNPLMAPEELSPAASAT